MDLQVRDLVEADRHDRGAADGEAAPDTPLVGQSRAPQCVPPHKSQVNVPGSYRSNLTIRTIYSQQKIDSGTLEVVYRS